MAFGSGEPSSLIVARARGQPKHGKSLEPFRSASAQCLQRCLAPVRFGPRSEADGREKPREAVARVATWRGT